MKQNLLIAVAIAMTGCSSVNSEKAQVNDTLSAMETLCPNCQVVGQYVLQTMHDQCDLPYNQESLEYVLQESQAYGFLLALNSVAPQGLPVFQEAMTQSVSCVSDDIWIDNTQALLKSERYASKLREQQG
ncbi:hypothetical protein J4N45_11200 [Vibrio sp. SCSIO 43140]|uniref:hypothetical protein n=1 Tax=Vibrio sp. SCSIO 43140 TaxID=2819100 RepID=UPI002075B238|nr:hypothetical protein [Vibrio sp. SCSIO 43140]USD59098.1 hypothetical protein J4N45_11200 [Vibrio sp. SCSIO 43140]